MPLRRLDAAFAALMLILGVYVLWQALDYDYFQREIAGPGFFPVWTGLLMVGLSLGNLWHALRGRALSGVIPGTELLQASLLVVVIVLFALIAPYIGMIYAAVPMVFLSGLVINGGLGDRRFLVTLAILSVAAPAICALIFGKLLRVPLL